MHINLVYNEMSEDKTPKSQGVLFLLANNPSGFLIGHMFSLGLFNKTGWYLFRIDPNFAVIKRFV